MRSDGRPRPCQRLQAARETGCPVGSKRPLHRRATAKMSPRIRTGPEAVPTDHAPTPSAAAATARRKPDQVPIPEQNFQVSPSLSPSLRLPTTRDIGVYWYLFSNHCPRRCIYENVIKRKKLSSSWVSSSSIRAPSSWRSHASHVNRLTSSPRSVPSRARLGM